MPRIRTDTHKFADGVPLCGEPGDMTHHDALVTCASCIMGERHPRGGVGDKVNVMFREMGRVPTAAMEKSDG